MVKLRVKNVEFSYASEPILRDVCLDVEASEIFGIVGPNGAGKTTLLRCIDRILKPAKGSILLNEKEMREMSGKEIARQMGYVPQINPSVFSITVFDMVLLGRCPHLMWRSSEGDIKKVLETLSILDIEDFAMKDFNELSGGQQQKVLIARALTQEPDIILLDEPTSNLDIKHQLEVMDIIKNLVLKKEISAIMAIHDLNLASRYADKIMMMKGGKVYAVGDPASVFTAENIKHVYGVEAIVEDNNGRPRIVPLRPV